MKADKLILGHILSVDSRLPMLEAITVVDGKIQYAGSVAVAKQLCDEHTQVLDYGDNYIYPGFIDAHCHGLMAGPRLAFYADMTPGTTMAEYLQIMKDYMAAHPDNNFYYGAGWQLRDATPTAAMLDEICSDKPMALNSIDGHSLWFNTAGMKKFGINEDAVKQWGTDIIHVGEDGKPIGYISEGPYIRILSQMTTMSDEDMEKAMLAWQNFALSLGFTACYEAGVNDRAIKMFDRLIKKGVWKLRVYAGYLIDEHAEDYVEEARHAKEMANRYNNEYFQIIGVKIFMDGVVEAHTAWTCKDYNDRPGYTGVKRMQDFDRVVALYKECAVLGLNVHQHTIGDGAVKFALDCIEKAQVESSNMYMRNELCHLQMIRKEDIKRLCDLNCVAVVAPLWMARTDGFYEQSVEYIGERRTFFSYPLESFLKNNGVIAFHSDYPVSSAISVPRSIYMACVRNEPGKDDFYQWNANECISRVDAVLGMTRGPAFACGQENHIGSLVIDSVANMAVFDKNFLTDDINEVEQSKIVATIVDGEEVYHA